MAHNFEFWFFLPRAADIHRENLFEFAAGRIIGPQLAGIPYPRFAAKMALLANTVARARRKPAWIDNRFSRRTKKVLFRRAVTPFTRDRFGHKRWILISIDRFSPRPECSGVAEQTLRSDGTIEVRGSVRLVSRRNVPDAAGGVVGDGRLEEPIADLHQVSKRFVTRPNDVGDRILGSESSPLDRLPHPSI
jgi:hypothetical protein